MPTTGPSPPPPRSAYSTFLPIGLATSTSVNPPKLLGRPSSSRWPSVQRHWLAARCAVGRLARSRTHTAASERRRRRRAISSAGDICALVHQALQATGRLSWPGPGLSASVTGSYGRYLQYTGWVSAPLAAVALPLPNSLFLLPAPSQCCFLSRLDTLPADFHREEGDTYRPQDQVSATAPCLHVFPPLEGDDGSETGCPGAIGRTRSQVGSWPDDREAAISWPFTGRRGRCWARDQTSPAIAAELSGRTNLLTLATSTLSNPIIHTSPASSSHHFIPPCPSFHV